MRWKTASRTLSLALVAFAGLAWCSPATRAAEPAPIVPSAGSSKAKPQGPFRNFYDVLEDLLSDFEYDIKSGNVQGLKDLSIRNVAVSENVPPSFKEHLELVVTERILRNSKTRIVQCLPCRAKRTTVNGDQVIITSPQTNPVELARIAKLSGIEHFMDIAFTYQPTGMILSFYITEPETGSVVWSRSYNSETSRAAAFRRGVDYSQIDNARKMTEYVPVIQYRTTAYYLFERNVNGMTGCLGVGVRMMERYDNRHKEVGFEMDYLRDSSTLVGAAVPAGEKNLFSGLNLTLLFEHSWNLIGPEENFNLVRGNIFIGVGGTYASGFLGGLVRGGYEWRLAKGWAVSTNLGFRPKATAFLGSTAVGTVSGVELGLGISHLF